jgi:glutathione reductase (NADPH)
MAEYDYDLIVIGAGSGGVRAARMAASFGARVAICEESRVGGTCVIRGCVPKKLLIYGTHFAEDFEDAAGYGWKVPAPSFNWAELLSAKNQEIDRLNGVYLRLLRESEVDLLEGKGRLSGANEVDVEGRKISAKYILVATGGWPVTPDIPGIEHVISSNEALELKSLPKSMVIVGGGYIAVEFAGIFNALGVEVTEILRADAILRGFDNDMRTVLSEEMRKKGVNIMCETVVRSIEKEKDGYNLRLANGGSVSADLVMYATGRTPNTKGLGLEAAGVEVDKKGHILVDNHSKTSVANIYAVGDVTGRIALTPVAITEAAALAETLFNDNPTVVDYQGIPSAVFSHPTLATVGLSEDDAKASYGEVDVYLSRFRPMKFTLSGRDEMAVMKVIVDPETDRVLGCHMMGLDAPEIIQGLAVAMKCGLTKKNLDATVGIHPSSAEEFVTLREKRPPHDASASN